MHFCSSISMLWGVSTLCLCSFQKLCFFFLSKNFVSLCLLRLIQSAFRSIKIVLKFLKKPLSVSINRNWFSINQNSWIKFFFFKSDLTCSNTFSKTFQTFFSLSDLARLHKDFFVVFLQISCKVSLSLSWYVYFTLPFALFFSFSCIISWFLGKFSNYA